MSRRRGKRRRCSCPSPRTRKATAATCCAPMNPKRTGRILWTPRADSVSVSSNGQASAYLRARIVIPSRAWLHAAAAAVHGASRSGKAAPMEAVPGQESRDAGAAGGSALAGRAWLAALPDELAAQRHVMAGLVDRCEAWPLAMSLLVGCSLGRGAADALSDIDAALGIDAPPGEAGAGRIGTAEAAVTAVLPELGTLVDVLRHRTGPAGQHVRRIFAQFADGIQLDLAVVAEAEIEARLRNGGAPDFIPLYRAPGPR